MFLTKATTWAAILLAADKTQPFRGGCFNVNLRY